MNALTISMMLTIAAQDPVTSSVQSALERNVLTGAVAILAAAVVAEFVVIMRQSKRIEQIHEDNRKANDERSKRVAEEFKDKDARLMEVAVKMTAVVERVEAAINTLSERIRDG